MIVVFPGTFSWIVVVTVSFSKIILKYNFVLYLRDFQLNQTEFCVMFLILHLED